MNKIRKAKLLAGCAVSSIGLAVCKDSKNNSSTKDTTNSYWLITEVGKYDFV